MAASLTTSPEVPQLCCAVRLLPYRRRLCLHSLSKENRGYNQSTAPSPSTPSSWHSLASLHTHPVMTWKINVSYTVARCGFRVVFLGAFQTRKWTEVNSLWPHYCTQAFVVSILLWLICATHKRRRSKLSSWSLLSCSIIEWAGACPVTKHPLSLRHQTLHPIKLKGHS